MARWILRILIVLVLLAAAGWLALKVAPVQDLIISRGLQAQVTRDLNYLYDDQGMRVFMCGTSSPLGDARRARACVTVFAGGRYWVVDTGTGSAANLAGIGLPGDRLGAVLLTHFHSDHITDLGEHQLRTWVGGRKQPMVVYGAPGVERVVAGYNEAYAQDAVYRNVHHGEEIVPADAGRMIARAVRPPAEGFVEVYSGEGLVIRMFAVDHDPVAPAVAYRFDYAGRSVVISGDAAFDPRMIEASRGVDVLFHDALSIPAVDLMQDGMEAVGNKTLAKVLFDIRDYHASTTEVADIANQAGVGLLAYYHLVPSPANDIMEAVFVRGIDEARDGNWVLTDDGMLITLPKGTDAIEVGKL